MARKRRNKKQKMKRWWIIIAILVAAILLSYNYRRPIYRTLYKVYTYSFKITRTKAPPKLQTKYALGVPLPIKYKVFGTDISRHQGKIQWDKLANFRFNGHKIEFVFIKATEGESWEDRQFNYNWKMAKFHQILRGAYHFYLPKVHSVKQMKNFTSVVKMEKGDLPPVLDVEVESSLSKSTYRKGVLNCLKIMEETYGVKPIIYTNQKLYRSYLKHKSFEDYQFWISRLKSTPPKIDHWQFWQFTYEAVIEGTFEYVDMNVFNGSKEELLKIRKL